MKNLFILCAVIMPVFLPVALAPSCQPQAAPVPPAPAPAPPAPVPTPSLEFEVSSLQVTPEEVLVGNIATIEANVSNVGNASGMYTGELRVNGDVVKTFDVTLAPGVTETVSFELVKEVAGVYKVQIDGLSETLVVRELPTVGPEKLGERKYDIEHEIALSNDGPGVASRVMLRVALVTMREPYQTVVLTNIGQKTIKQLRTNMKTLLLSSNLAT